MILIHFLVFRFNSKYVQDAQDLYIAIVDAFLFPLLLYLVFSNSQYFAGPSWHKIYVSLKEQNPTVCIYRVFLQKTMAK
jgi:hypothetical protein